ncbi:MAG: hypothetical protein J0H74_16335 [Chitinophagaceae bacterium]|nr:hypothetical protein [Chitinophagaceae bacterium]
MNIKSAWSDHVWPYKHVGYFLRRVVLLKMQFPDLCDKHFKLGFGLFFSPHRPGITGKKQFPLPGRQIDGQIGLISRNPANHIHVHSAGPFAIGAFSGLPIQFLAKSFYIVLIHISFAKASGTFGGFFGVPIEKALKEVHALK